MQYLILPPPLEEVEGGHTYSDHFGVDYFRKESVTLFHHDSNYGQNIFTLLYPQLFIIIN